MTFPEFLLLALLFLIGLTIVVFVHLIVTILVVTSKKTFVKKLPLWLIAIAGGLLGFILCAIVQEEFRGGVGAIQSAFWVIMNYLILKKKCYEKNKKEE